MILCRLGFHRWQKWSQYIRESVSNPLIGGVCWFLTMKPHEVQGWFAVTEPRATRSCRRCGEIEDVEL